MSHPNDPSYPNLPWDTSETILRLQDVGEYALIERIRALLPPPPPELVVGVGDDAALWQPTPGYLLALTCDGVVEEQHFPSFAKLSRCDVQSVGYRAAQINLSDIAAMAAIPRFALVSLALPVHLDVQTIETFYTGLVEAFLATQVTIVGGNLTATSGPFHAHITLGGEVLPGKSRLRTGSRPGDWIGVTGYPGSSAAGLHCWLHPEQTPWFHQTHPDPHIPCSHARTASFSDSVNAPHDRLPVPESPCAFWLHPEVQSLMQAYLRPTARLQESQILAPYLHALTDISDGLLLDLSNLLQSQGLGAILQASQLPYLSASQQLCHHIQKKPYHWIFSASDDYELLFTVPPEHVTSLERVWATRTQTPLHWIGQITDRSGGICLQEDHQTIPLPPHGWQHFLQTP